MKIACNQPFRLAYTRYDADITFLDDDASANVIVLLLSDIWGDSGILEMEKLISAIRKYDKSTPCYLIGAKTRVPNSEFEKYKSSKRDKIIRELVDEVLSRSKSIIVYDELTCRWLVEYFGYAKEKVDILQYSSIDASINSITRYFEKQNNPVPISGDDIYWFYNGYAGRKPHSIFKDEYCKDIVIGCPKVDFINENTLQYYSDILIDGKKERLFLEADRNLLEYLVLDRCDAFLIGVLPFAMHYNHNIVCEGSVSEQLLHNIKYFLLPHLINHDKRLYDVKIIAQANTKDIQGDGVGTAVSGGVDSFFTIMEYYNNHEFPSMALTNLYVGNYLYDGPKAKEQIIARANGIASELNLPLIITDTNITKIFDKYIAHIFYHTYKTFFGIFAIRKLWKIYYYSSAYDFSHFSIEDNSTYDCAGYELLLVNTFSVTGFTVISGGARAERPEKTKAITKFPLSHKYLNVCSNPSLEKNCSVCSKCVRTLLNLEMCGKLDEYRPVFDIDLYKKNKEKNLRMVINEKNRDNTFFIDAYDYFFEKEPELMKRIENKI